MSDHEDLFEGLSDDQSEALTAVQSGQSIFVTGPGGTGKSEWIKRVTTYFERQKFNFWLTATTGIAAVNIQGRTIHSAFRLNPDMDNLSNAEYGSWLQTQKDLYKAKKDTKAISFTYLKQLRNLQWLIIDEVSMLSVDLFEKLDVQLKSLRNSSRPLGGLRVILVGDFFQLPPVKKPKFLFESPLFYQCISKMIRFSQSFRQQDTSFVDLLARMRKGLCTPADISVLESRVDRDVSKDGIQPTVLYSRNMDVDRVNTERLRSLTGPTETYVLKKNILQASTSLLGKRNRSHEASEYQWNSFLKNLRLDEVSTMKLGAQVMLTYNLDVKGGLCNGSRGVIVGFSEISEDADEDSIFSKYNIEEPLAYPKIRMPVVKFVNGRQVVVPYVRWTQRLSGSMSNASSSSGPDHETEPTLMCAWGLPLKLAWATTIHKCQGLTLDCVTIECNSKIFEAGQAYVAVSRVKDLNGLSFTSFDASVITCNEKVMFFDSHSYEYLKDHFSSGS